MEITVKTEPRYLIELTKRELQIIEDCVNFAHNNLDEEQMAEDFTIDDATEDEVVALWNGLYTAWSRE